MQNSSDCIRKKPEEWLLGPKYFVQGSSDCAYIKLHVRFDRLKAHKSLKYLDFCRPPNINNKELIGSKAIVASCLTSGLIPELGRLKIGISERTKILNLSKKLKLSKSIYIELN